MAKLKVLGCSDAFHSGGRFQSSYLITAGGSSIMLDCGSGALQQLKRYGIPSGDIRCIVLSHLHGDHIGGMPFLFLDMGLEKRTKELTVFSPRGGKKIIRQCIDLYYPGKDDLVDSLPITWLEYESRQPISCSELDLLPFKVEHEEKVFPHGVRIHWQGKIIAFSGDTEWTDELIPLCDDADMFICECTFFEKDIGGHLNYRQLMDKMDVLRFKKIMLTHFDTEMLAHAEEVELPMAEDGLEIEF